MRCTAVIDYKFKLSDRFTNRPRVRTNVSLPHYAVNQRAFFARKQREFLPAVLMLALITCGYAFFLGANF